MTISKGFRDAARDFLRTAAHVVAATLVTAMFVVLWSGPTAAATGSRAAASGSPVRVKFYIVPPAGNGPAESLYEIAAKTLGDGNRYAEIFNLNKGRLQPDGGRLENPHTIVAGWILQLPADGAGPGVRFGPLPLAGAAATPSASHRPSRPVARGAAAPHSSFSEADLVGGALILVTTAGLAVAVSRHRRRAGAAGRRRATHAKAPGSPASDRTGRPAKPGLSAHAGHPSRPSAGQPSGLTADHPSWPGTSQPSGLTADHPSWPGTSQPSGLTADHPSWPGTSQPSGLTADHPSWPGTSQPSGPRALGRSARQPPESPSALPDDHRWQTASPSALVPHAGVPAGHWSPATGLTTRAAGILQLTREEAAEPVDAVRRQAEELWNTDSVRLAGRILSEADNQAAEIRRQASDQAAATLAAADREAAQTRRQASDQAAVTLEAADREAAELRAAVMTMSAELGGVAAYVTESLTSPPKQATKPAARPETRPKARQATKPAAQPDTKPRARPRQYAAMRLTRVAVAALFLLAVIAGTTELALHGYRFFVFRSAGTGSTPDSGLNEDQGPGQPDAPGAHHHLNEHKP